ncbi:MAG: dehydrogenase, partial [Muribaculaceae bacterium]|nr:dehydrogenase [Muribaculaceae bacterium]
LAGSKGKFGFFTTEKELFTRIATELGVSADYGPGGEVRYKRHPLVYIVEAADDICYEVMDLEDAHKLRILSTQEVIDHLLAFFKADRRERMMTVMDTVADPNEKIAYLRSCVVGALVNCCAATFVDNEEAILWGEFDGSLLKNITDHERKAYSDCSDLSWAKIYRASEVVDVELAGNRIITFLMDKLIHAVRHPELNYSRLLLSKVPEQYDVNAPDLFGKIQAVLDHMSGMTDVYALDLYRRLNGMSLPAV